MRTIKNIIFPRKSALSKKRSFMMIEIIIDFSVITLIALAVLFAQMVSMKFINNAKARATAIELANEQMENIRNIAYGDVGMAGNTDSGIPTGAIEKESLLSRNGMNFKLITSITYIDDPYDGCSTDSASENCRSQPIATGSSKIDSTKYDYKKVDISVLKPDKTFVLAKISSNFSNKSSIIAAGTGVIHVCVNDKNGTRVPGVTVTLENDSIPGFSKRLAKLSDNINDSACVSFDMLTPVENHSYHVAVNKRNDPNITYLSNYSSDQTSPPSAANPFPRHPDLNVNTKQPTSLTLVIDKVSTLRIKILDSVGNLIPGSCQGEVTPAPFVVTTKSDFARSGSTNINTELDAPEGDISIKAKNMESQIDLKYIYEQNASRITINSSDATSKSRRGRVIDNDDSTFWQAPVIPSQKVHILPYWMMDLGQIYDITKIQLIFANNLFAVQYSADSTNGSNGVWSDLVVDTAAIGNPSGQVISARMRYIKIISTNPSDPTSADIINELRLYRAVAYSTYISAPTQFDSGLNAQNVKHIKQWVSLQPSEEDSTSAGADYNGTKILYSYRGSNNADVASPTWGAWTALVDYTGTALSLSSMGQYRFIQVRIDFISTADNKSPVLHDFTLNYKICATGGGSTNFSLAVSITSSKLSYDSPNIAKYRDTDSFGSTSYLSMSTYNYNPLSVSTSHSAGLEWDDYILSVAASTGYYIISVGSAIFSNGMPIIHLEPGDAKNVDLYVTKDANYARIRSIAPVAARCNTQATVNISGEVLKSNSIIQLKKDNSVINSSNFYYIDDKNIQADFDIPSGSAGIWDVVVTNPGTSTGDTITTQFKGFSITD